MAGTAKKYTDGEKKRAAANHHGKPKRRKMNWKERIGVVFAIGAALTVCVVALLNTPLLDYSGPDETGNQINMKVSLLRKFKLSKPFEELDGTLESKVYSLEIKEEADDVLEPGEKPFDDGLDLNQIREGQFSVLFLGMDESRSNTDVMMLVMFDIAANQINILQIPRDTFVPDYTAFEAGKINSVYSMGSGDGSGVQRVVDCIEDMFQIPIDRYVTTGCNDIVRIVDLIGGIPINMPYTIEYEPGKTIYEGEQVLDGQKSEWMVRYRHGYNEGDIGRMKAQRIFMAAAMKKVCDIGTIELMRYMNTIVDEKLIGSNLSIDEMSKLSDFAVNIGMEKIAMYMLPGEGYNYTPPDWKDYDLYSVWSIHKDPTIDLLNTYFRPYYKPIFQLPNVKELVWSTEYKNTSYDNDSTTFAALDSGDTFDGT